MTQPTLTDDECLTLGERAGCEFTVLPAELGGRRWFKYATGFFWNGEQWEITENRRGAQTKLVPPLN